MSVMSSRKNVRQSSQDRGGHRGEGRGTKRMQQYSQRGKLDQTSSKDGKERSHRNGRNSNAISSKDETWHWKGKKEPDNQRRIKRRSHSVGAGLGRQEEDDLVVKKLTMWKSKGPSGLPIMKRLPKDITSPPTASSWRSREQLWVRRSDVSDVDESVFVASDAEKRVEAIKHHLIAITNNQTSVERGQMFSSGRNTLITPMAVALSQSVDQSHDSPRYVNPQSEVGELDEQLHTELLTSTSFREDGQGGDYVEKSTAEQPSQLSGSHTKVVDCALDSRSKSGNKRRAAVDSVSSSVDSTQEPQRAGEEEDEYFDIDDGHHYRHVYECLSRSEGRADLQATSLTSSGIPELIQELISCVVSATGRKSMWHPTYAQEDPLITKLIEQSKQVTVASESKCPERRASSHSSHIHGVTHEQGLTDELGISELSSVETVEMGRERLSFAEGSVPVPYTSSSLAGGSPLTPGSNLSTFGYDSPTADNQEVLLPPPPVEFLEIGRASCRERV
mgnify:FL=1